MTGKGKQIIKNIIKIVGLLAMILIIDRIIGFYIEPVKYSDYFNHDPVYKRAQKEGSDLIFMGGSHMEMCMNPRVFEEELGYKNVLNVSATDQPIKGLYFYLKQLGSECNPKCVVVDITNQNLFRPPVYQGQINVMDKMKFPYNLMYYFSDENLIKATPYLLRTYKYRDFLFSDVRVRKADVALSGYQEGDGYEFGGFERTLPLYEIGGIPYENYLGDDSSEVINEEPLEYLLKMKKYCDEREIQFYTVSCPISLMSVYSTEDYEERLQQYVYWATENGIKYHNLSYLRDREEIIGDEMWDPGHVSGESGSRISKVYADILASDMEGRSVDDYFYSSRDEMKEDINRVLSVRGEISGQDNMIYVKLDSIHNDDVKPLYKVTLIELGKETVELDWSEETEVIFESGFIRDDTIVQIEAKGDIYSDEQPVAKQYYYLAKEL